MPFTMLQNLSKSPLAKEQWDGVVWYAPSIFHGPMVSALRKSSRCKSYLIIRDIFPEWAVDMGLMGRGLPYRFFDAVARYQYSVADVIGVQTSGNLRYFDRWKGQPGRELEVLQNWLDKPKLVQCSVRVVETALAGRKVFVYAGNMGIAQGIDILLDLAEKMAADNTKRFLDSDWQRSEFDLPVFQNVTAVLFGKVREFHQVEQNAVFIIDIISGVTGEQDKALLYNQRADFTTSDESL
jgi:hypothetical protein